VGPTGQLAIHRLLEEIDEGEAPQLCQHAVELLAADEAQRDEDAAKPVTRPALQLECTPRILRCDQAARYQRLSQPCPGAIRRRCGMHGPFTSRRRRHANL
jgi:hypothetical protein